MMDNKVLDYILNFLNINKKDVEYNEKFIKMRRAEKTLDSIVQGKTKKANNYFNDINSHALEPIYKKPINLKLHYYRDPGKIMNSFIAMEYTVCGNISDIDDNTKAAIYRIIIPEIIKEYNKTNISDTVKIKEGSMFEATVILYQE